MFVSDWTPRGVELRNLTDLGPSSSSEHSGSEKHSKVECFRPSLIPLGQYFSGGSAATAQQFFAQPTFVKIAQASLALLRSLISPPISV